MKKIFLALCLSLGASAADISETDFEDGLGAGYSCSDCKRKPFYNNEYYSIFFDGHFIDHSQLYWNRGRCLEARHKDYRCR